jgi:hypothetical protein
MQFLSPKLASPYETLEYVPPFEVEFLHCQQFSAVKENFKFITRVAQNFHSAVRETRLEQLKVGLPGID